MTPSIEQLQACFPAASAQRISEYYEPLRETVERFKINTPARLSCFMAQIGHESGDLRYSKEIASGAAYDVGDLAKALGNTPEDDGDGERYKGRGLIQITGTTNYRLLSKALGIDFIAKPELLEGPLFAALSAGWFWDFRKLNDIADWPEGQLTVWKGQQWDSFRWISRMINGYNSKIKAPNGMEDRLKRYVICKKVFGVTS